MLPKKSRVAVVSARGLGDGLLAMILSRNLAFSGYDVTTFSSILCELSDWFPGQKHLPFPSSADFQKTFATFDMVIAADHAMVRPEHDFGNRLIVLKQSEFDRSKTMVENLQQVCAERLALPYAERENGLVIPESLAWRAHERRVVLHPMSADPRKNWPKAKFLKLAQELEQEGYEPVFCMNATERDEWKGALSAAQLPSFPTVHELACYLFESGALIGNDSGVGHLASALNIPTLSLFARKSYAQLWRPGWKLGVVATPPPLLIGAPLKQKYWKNLLTVSQVKRAFKNIEAER